MRICGHWSADPPGLRFEPLKLLNFALIADPSPAIHSNANVYPYPAFEKSTDPDPQPATYQCGSTQTWILSVIVGLASGLGVVDAGPGGVAIQKLLEAQNRAMEGRGECSQWRPRGSKWSPGWSLD